ncbi:MAG TPA: hypothetical protein VGE50_12430 [Gammaproteobacteria bacterium]
MDNKPRIPLLLNSPARLAIAALMAALFMGVFLAFEPPQWVSVAIASLLTFAMVSSVFLLRMYIKLMTSYQSSESVDMVLHLRAMISDDMEVWFAELRKPSTPIETCDVSFAVAKTAWIDRLEDTEQVKVYGDYSVHGFLIETRLGLLWPSSIRYFPKYYKKF